jgi:membrane protease YdiL (CAAX protease family)/uncharacterized RDD family membrane protein YckC
VTLTYESLFNRFVAALIDNVLWIVAIFYFLGYVPASVYEDHPEAVGIALIALLSLWFNYFAFSEWRWGRTVGKHAMGMRVTTLDGGRISFGASSIRNLLRLVDWLLIGWLMIASTERHQRLGDKAAKTVVVRRRSDVGVVANAPDAAPVASPSESSGAADSPHPAKPPGKPAERLPEVTWSARDAVWATIAGLILSLIFAPLLVLPFDPDLDSLGALLAAQGLLDGTLIVVAIGMASGWSRDSVRRALGRLGLRRFSLVAIPITLATLFAYYMAAGLIVVGLDEIGLSLEQEDIGEELGLDQGTIAAIAAVVLIAGLAPVAEETFFRGFFFAGLRRRLSLWPAALISGLVFGLIHAPTGVTTVIPLSILGAALAWLYERTGSLWPPILAHAFNNGLALALTT